MAELLHNSHAPHCTRPQCPTTALDWPMVSPYPLPITTALQDHTEASHERLTGQRCAKAVAIQINWYLATNTYRYSFISPVLSLLQLILNKGTLRCT
jgi:hypothetical protein